MKFLNLKNQDEKEIKMGLLLNQLLEFIEQKIGRISNSEDMEEFSDILMKIFENKIFPIQKLNFV